ncbi:hypothetical protein [Longispora urticae]
MVPSSEPHGTTSSVWWSRTTSWRAALVLLALAALLAITGTALPGLARLGVLTCAALLILLAATVCQVVVRIDVYAVRVHRGLLPGAGTRVPLRMIRSVRTVPAGPWSWDGWGWRWLPRRSRAVLLRSGEALELELISGALVLVSVDDARQATLALRLMDGHSGGVIKNSSIRYSDH